MMAPSHGTYQNLSSRECCLYSPRRYTDSPSSGGGQSQRLQLLSAAAIGPRLLWRSLFTRAGHYYAPAMTYSDIGMAL